MSHRDDVIKGLRMLADYFEDNPDAPVPTYPTFSHCVLAADDAAGTAEVERIASILGVNVEHGVHVTADRKFAGLSYEAFYSPRARMEQHERLMAAGRAAIAAADEALAGAR